MRTGRFSPKTKGENMRSLRILGIAVMAMAALLALGGSALASTVTSPTGTAYTGKLKGTSIGHGVLHNPIAKIECNVVIEGEIGKHGKGVTAEGTATNVTIGPCTNNWHVTTAAMGTVIAHWTGGYNGTIVSDGATVETTRFGVTCRYVTNNTSLGVATGGNPGSMDLEAFIPFHGGSPLCGSGATRLTGNGTTTPEALYLSE
jgi:hypothetical protein